MVRCDDHLLTFGILITSNSFRIEEGKTGSETMSDQVPGKYH